MSEFLETQKVSPEYENTEPFLPKFPLVNKIFVLIPGLDQPVKIDTINPDSLTPEQRQGLLDQLPEGTRLVGKFA